MKNKKVSKGAVISVCGKYRYSLIRTYTSNPVEPFVLFIGLNPSIADSNIDDPTLRRCLGFMEDWNLKSLKMVNLFAFRATDPREMIAQTNPTGLSNDLMILHEIKQAAKIVICWGNKGSHLDRDKEVLEILKQYQDKVFSFGETKTGQPKHPLYLAKTTQLKKYFDINKEPNQ